MHPDDYHFDFFYISYLLSGGVVGSTIMKQNKIHPGCKNPNGMNIVSAYALVNNISNGLPCVIISYQETTAKRYHDYNDYFLASQKVPEPKKVKLELVKNELEPPHSPG